jgi:biofilm PGA synthesis N-glycosyltransferase PgaC
MRYALIAVQPGVILSGSPLPLNCEGGASRPQRVFRSERAALLTQDVTTGTSLSYVLITPARNEEKHIRLTLASMAAQNHRPLRWVIVSDGSTDKTDAVVEEFARTKDWIDLVRLPEARERSFAAKVTAFNAGFDRIKHLKFEVIGNLDADISFDPDYFEFLLARFAEEPRLGVAGTPFVESGMRYDYRFTNVEHVSGACQLFRRECFAEIGGYVPIRGGGIDWTAVTTARMRRWKTRTFTEKVCVHNRPMGTGAGNQLAGFFRHGQKDYYLGGHPIWQLARCAYQFRRPPYVIRGLTLLAGYCWAGVLRHKKPISPELIQFHRREQMARLKAAFVRRRV